MMDKIELIKAEIERRKKSLRAGICNEEVFTRKQRKEMLVASEELNRLNRFLSTIEVEEPVCEELEKEIKRYGEKNMFNIPAFQQVARHFANWQKEQMLKKAVGWIKWNNDNGGCLFDGWQDDFIKTMED